MDHIVGSFNKSVTRYLETWCSSHK